MPTLHFMHKLSGQPDQEVGCEMFEETTTIPSERGKLCYCVKENGLYKVYKAPLVDTTDERASKLRVMKGAQEYAISKGDYSAEGSWQEIYNDYASVLHVFDKYFDVGGTHRTPADASGYNLRITWWRDGPSYQGELYHNSDLIDNFGKSYFWKDWDTKYTIYRYASGTTNIWIDSKLLSSVNIKVEVFR